MDWNTKFLSFIWSEKK